MTKLGIILLIGLALGIYLVVRKFSWKKLRAAVIAVAIANNEPPKIREERQLTERRGEEWDYVNKRPRRR